MSSSTKEVTGAESEEDSSNSVVEDSAVSSKPEEDDKQPPVAKKKGSGDTSTSSTITDPPTSATVATVVVGRPASQSELPTVAAAAAAAAPPVPLRVKKSRRAGYREPFLQKLREMLDRESQNDSTIVQWTTDGNSFIITDQTQFEADIIPTYFDTPIVFASFLRKLYRWGFHHVSIRQTGLHEFRSLAFRRLGAKSAPPAAAVNTCSTAGGGASIQVQQQLTQASSPSLQQVMAQINQPPPPRPLPSQADAIADLISNFQRQRSSQQPSIPSQQSVLNQNSTQPNNTDALGILQSIVGSSIQMQQQPNQASSSSLQQVMALINQPPPPNSPPSQADAIAELISNFQRSSQQPLTTSQQSVLNQNSNQPNNTDALGVLQSIVGSSIQMQPNQASSSLLQLVMAQINQPPPPNSPPSQADAIAELISNFQRQRSSQQPSIPSQQSVLNQNSNQPNNTDALGILQSIVGSSIQMQQQPNQASLSLLQLVMAHINQPPPPNPPPNQADAIADLITNIQRQRSSQQPSIPSQHSVMNHQLNTNLDLQSFQQWQNPNPTMNLINTALSILVGSQTPSAHQRNAIQALMSLYGMSLSAGTFPNTNTSPQAMPQPNDMAVQSLVMPIHRVCEDERQRRVQADATQNAIIANIGQILGLGSGGGNTTGMTVSVPDNIAFHAHQGIPPPSAGSGSLNFQADPIAAILQAARSGAGGQLEEVAPQTQIGPVDDDDNDGNDEGTDDHDGRPLSQRKRKCPDDGHLDDDNSPRKKK